MGGRRESYIVSEKNKSLLSISMLAERNDFLRKTEEGKRIDGKFIVKKLTI